LRNAGGSSGVTSVNPAGGGKACEDFGFKCPDGFKLGVADCSYICPVMKDLAVTRCWDVWQLLATSDCEPAVVPARVEA
jgi:hypothetical protein